MSQQPLSTCHKADVLFNFMGGPVGIICRQPCDVLPKEEVIENEVPKDINTDRLGTGDNCGRGSAISTEHSVGNLADSYLGERPCAPRPSDGTQIVTETAGSTPRGPLDLSQFEGMTLGHIACRTYMLEQHGSGVIDWSKFPDEKKIESSWEKTAQAVASVAKERQNRNLIQATEIIDQLTAELEEEREKNKTRSAKDVLNERNRQKEKEGWTPEHDDEHGTGDIALAAAAYARHAAQSEDNRQINSGYPPDDLWPSGWPWKPSDRRRDLVKAGALILAEIERLDRIEARGAKP